MRLSTSHLVPIMRLAKTEDPVVVIEIQMGSYFGEDDIVRVSDPYGR